MIVIGFSIGAQILIQILSVRPHLIDFAMINSALVKPMPFAGLFIKPCSAFSSFFKKIERFQKCRPKRCTSANLILKPIIKIAAG